MGKLVAQQVAQQALVQCICIDIEHADKGELRVTTLWVLYFCFLVHSEI